MKFLRVFETTAAAQTFSAPYNVIVYNEQSGKVGFVEKTETRIICTYVVTEEQSQYSTMIFSITPQEYEMPLAFESMEIDGIEYNNITYEDCNIQLSQGTHIIKYTLADNYLTDNRTILSNYAFAGCRQITSVILPNGIKSIGAEVFSDCNALTSIMLPSTLETIGIYAFNETALNSIVFPENVTNIGQFAIYGGDLTSITSLNSVPPTLGNYNFYLTPADCPIYVPAASVDAYKAANGWSTRAAYIQAISE